MVLVYTDGTEHMERCKEQHKPVGKTAQGELESGAERGAKLCCDLPAENPGTEISGK